MIDLQLNKYFIKLAFVEPLKHSLCLPAIISALKHESLKGAVNDR